MSAKATAEAERTTHVCLPSSIRLHSHAHPDLALRRWFYHFIGNIFRKLKSCRKWTPEDIEVDIAIAPVVWRSLSNGRRDMISNGLVFGVEDPALKDRKAA